MLVSGLTSSALTNATLLMSAAGQTNAAAIDIYTDTNLPGSFRQRVQDGHHLFNLAQLLGHAEPAQVASQSKIAFIKKEDEEAPESDPRVPDWLQEQLDELTQVQDELTQVQDELTQVVSQLKIAFIRDGSVKNDTEVEAEIQRLRDQVDELKESVKTRMERLVILLLNSGQFSQALDLVKGSEHFEDMKPLFIEYGEQLLSRTSLVLRFDPEFKLVDGLIELYKVARAYGDKRLSFAAGFDLIEKLVTWEEGIHKFLECGDIESGIDVLVAYAFDVHSARRKEAIKRVLDLGPLALSKLEKEVARKEEWLEKQKQKVRSLGNRHWVPYNIKIREQILSEVQSIFEALKIMPVSAQANASVILDVENWGVKATKRLQFDKLEGWSRYGRIPLKIHYELDAPTNLEILLDERNPGVSVVTQDMEGGMSLSSGMSLSIWIHESVPIEFKDIVMFHELTEAEYGLGDGLEKSEAHKRAVIETEKYVQAHLSNEQLVKFRDWQETVNI